MAGKQRGAANQFQLKTGNMKATYFHRASHQLNLALSKASKIRKIYNVVCLMQTVGFFFKFSPKRQRALERSVEHVCKKNHENPNKTKTKLKPLWNENTRWVERHTAFSDIEALYEPLLDCLDFIEANEKKNILEAVFDICYGTRCTLKRTKHFTYPSVGGAIRFANLQLIFCKA